MMSTSVNHLTAAFSGEETAKQMSNQAILTHVCLLHFKNIFCLVKTVQKEIKSAIVVSKRVYSQKILCCDHVLIAFITSLGTLNW